MKIRSTSISLLNYKLSSAAGGSGVTEVDVIVCDMVAQDGLDRFGFSYAIGGRGAAAVQSARVLADEIVTGAELEHVTSHDLTLVVDRYIRDFDHGGVDSLAHDSYALGGRILVDVDSDKWHCGLLSFIDHRSDQPQRAAGSRDLEKHCAGSVATNSWT